MKKHPLTVYLDDDQVEWLREEAARRRCSLSQLIRMLIAEKQEARE